MNPNKPRVDSMAMFSTRVIACSASARSDGAHISVMTPLLAGADPDARGNNTPADNLVSDLESNFKMHRLPR